MHILVKPFLKYYGRKLKFFMYFLFMTFVDVYDIDIELELKYYPSRD